MKERAMKLLEVKSIVTILLTVCMVFLVCGAFSPNETVLTLYSTTYGAIITYFFTRKDEGK